LKPRLSQLTIPDIAARVATTTQEYRPMARRCNAQSDDHTLAINDRIDRDGSLALAWRQMESAGVRRA